MANKTVFRGEQLVDLGGGVFVPKVVAVTTTGVDISGGSGGDASAANQTTLNTEVGIVTETAPASDTASSGLNGRLQRVAQNLSSLLALFPATAALADAVTNPTLSKLGVFLHGFNGTTWDRQRTALNTAGPMTTGVAAVGMYGLNGATEAELRPVEVMNFGADALAATYYGAFTHGRAYGFNGTNWDRARNNTAVQLLASAARTTTQTSADIVNYNSQFLRVVLDMTNVAASPSVTVTIQAKTSTGIYHTLLAGAAITTVTTNVYTIGPGLPATTNVSANSPLSRTFRIVVTANNANSGTYSVDYDLLGL